ncbi:cytochrome b [Stella humosa]|uniref:Cytochrome b n=1 Tax=Stella humosa TaxID=94 RepID=A0A3N1MCD0_9PROT|nr:cytochrome b/b6 domain-containing protein [Stella humosa]ROQ01373.1 cytochrome b [Stella humosa]BBK31747.1 cytochrome b561 [Stella humosa]
MARRPFGERVKVWDGAVRLVHWGIVVTFGVSWWSISNGRMDIHLPAGYTMMALVLFRILWGFVGSDTARFSRFVRGPAAVLGYARTMLKPRGSGTLIGHNPLGALSVLALLGLLLAQVLLGLFAVDTDGIESGPLAHLVSFDTGRLASWLHGLGFDALRIVAAIHILAVLYYLVVKRNDLIGPMITGIKRLPITTRRPVRMVSPWIAAVLFAVVAGLVWLLVTHPPR